MKIPFIITSTKNKPPKEVAKEVIEALEKFKKAQKAPSLTGAVKKQEGEEEIEVEITPIRRRFEKPRQQVWVGYFKDKKYGDGWRIVKAETIKPPYRVWDKAFRTRNAALRFVFKKDWDLIAEPRE